MGVVLPNELFDLPSPEGYPQIGNVTPNEPTEKELSLVQECTDEYYFEDKGSKIKINVLIPVKFKNLWIHKLSELKTTMKEIEVYEDQ